jgi:hypothetical protein
MEDIYRTLKYIKAEHAIAGERYVDSVDKDNPDSPETLAAAREYNKKCVELARAKAREAESKVGHLSFAGSVARYDVGDRRGTVHKGKLFESTTFNMAFRDKQYTETLH